MRALFVLQHVNFFRNLETVARQLHARGHEVTVLHGTLLDAVGTEKKNSGMKFGRGLEVVQSEIPGVAVGYRPETTEPWHQFLCIGRQVVNCSIYMRPEHPSPDRVLELLEKRFSAGLQRRMKQRWVRWLLRQESTQRLWRWVEAASPPSPTILEQLEKHRPDVILVSPTIWPKDPMEPDYIHAARALGVPSIGYISGWDNLTSKGTIHVLPDALLVWNEPMAREAIDLHSVPRETVRIVGAPHLDHFFAMRPTETRADVCRRIGCPSDMPYLLYLCSSRTLISNEVPVVSALADTLSRRFGGRLNLVVRPHPTNANIWNDFADPRIVVWPKRGDMADCPAAWQGYYNDMANAAAVFGLNTTAFLEAAVADRPCLTIVSDEFYAAQGKTGHFRHLIAGDFLEVAGDNEEVADNVERILLGADAKAAGRKQFVIWFLRPCGVDTPASLVVTEILESMARPRSTTRDALTARRPVRKVHDPVPGLVLEPSTRVRP